MTTAYSEWSHEQYRKVSKNRYLLQVSMFYGKSSYRLCGITEASIFALTDWINVFIDSVLIHQSKQSFSFGFMILIEKSSTRIVLDCSMCAMLRVPFHNSQAGELKQQRW